MVPTWLGRFSGLLTVYKVHFISLPWLLLLCLQGLLEYCFVIQVEMKTLSIVPVVSLQGHFENTVYVVSLCVLCGFSDSLTGKKICRYTEIHDIACSLDSALI